MVHGLVAAGDAQRGGVVVGPEVQPGAAALGGVHHRRDRRRVPSAQQDRLRGLHLDLEAERTLGQPVRPLQPSADVDHRAHLGHRGDLGQRDDPARPAARPRSSSAPSTRSSDRSPRRRVAPSSDLNRMPRNGGAVPALTAAAMASTGRDGVPILLLVRPGAVAVLEIDPQVLDRLGSRAWPRRLAQTAPTSSTSRPVAAARSSGRRRVLGQRGQAAAAPHSSSQVRMEPVGRHVDGVHGLPVRPISGVGTGPGRIVVGQQLVDGGQVGLGEGRAVGTCLSLLSVLLLHCERAG